jgi:ATP-binding cassette subfamily F protein 3
VEAVVASKPVPTVSKNELSKLESQIQEWETKKKQVEEELSKPSVYSNVTLLSETNSKLEKVSKELEELYAKWEAVMG